MLFNWSQDYGKDPWVRLWQFDPKPTTESDSLNFSTIFYLVQWNVKLPTKLFFHWSSQQDSCFHF